MIQPFFNSDGTGVTVFITIIGSDGNHVDPDSWPITNDPAIVLSSHPSAAKTVTKVDDGVFKVVWSSLSPALTHGEIIYISIDGAISGTAWTTWVTPIQVVHLPAKVSDTQDIQSRLPATLNSGRMVSYVEDVGAVAQQQIGERTANVDILTSPYSANTLGRVIRDSYLDLATIDTVVDGIFADTNDIQNRLPAALVGGRIDASVGAMANNVITAAAMATDASAEIADAVWDESYAAHTTAGTFGKLMDIIRKANLSIDGEVTSAITPTTLTFSSNVSATSSAYAHAVLLFVSGPLEGENSPIISYNSTNGVFLLEEELTAAPSAGDEFVIIAGSHVHSVVDIQAGLATSAELTEIKGATWSSSTDTLEAISDAAGAGGTTIIPAASFAPARTDTTNLIAYVGETIDQLLTVYEADGTTPLDLSGKTLTVVFEDMEQSDTGVVASASVTVSGDNNNIVTFAYPSAVTDEIGQFRYALRDEAAPKTVYSQGLLLVKAAANKD